MAERGDVFQLKRRLGFGADREAERVVVVQATRLNSVLPSVVAVPLDPQLGAYTGPLGVRVSAAEAGARTEHVAIPSWLQVLRQDRLAPGRVGSLRPRTMAELAAKLRLVLDL